MFARFTDETRWRLLLLLALVTSLGVGVSFVTRRHSEWDDVYRAAARRLQNSESLYPPRTSYTYPPFSAALITPFTQVSDRTSRIAWYAINLVAAACIFSFAWRLSRGTNPLVRDVGIFWLGMLVGLPFLFHTLAHQQTDLVVSAIVLGGCYAWSRDRSMIAATCFGLAAAMKCTPLLFAPYLLLKGRPFAAIWVVAVAVLANLLPDTIHRPNDASCHLAKWFELYILPMMKPDYAPGVWASEIIYNQSLVGAANRWFGSTMSPVELKRATYGLFAGMAALGLAALQRGRRHPQAIAWECSLVMAAMLLFSPMSSVPHFATMLLPGWLAARAVMAERQWAMLPFLSLMVIGSVASNKDLLGSSLYAQGLWCGSVMWVAVGAYGAAVVALASRSSSESSRTVSGAKVHFHKLANRNRTLVWPKPFARSE